MVSDRLDVESTVTLTVNDLDQNAYGELDIDENLTVSNETFMSGNVRVNVAVNKTFDAGAMSIDGVGTILNMITAGTFQADTVDIDADTPDAARTLKVAGSGATFEVFDKLSVTSDQTSGTNRAKLWVLTGTVDINDGDGTNGILEVDGGDHITRKAELDIDDILIAEKTQFLSGHVAIDVATGKTAKGGDVVFNDGAIVIKTGSGTFRSGPV